MAKIIVQRRNETIYSLMKFHVYLDGNEVGSLKVGEQLSLDVKSDNYNLVIKAGLLKSGLFKGDLLFESNIMEFDLKENETKTFMAEYFKDGFVKRYIKLSLLES